MEFLKSLITKLKSGPSKGIGIYISAESTLEMVEYDSNLGDITNYCKTELQYDVMGREINIENFEKVLQGLLRRFEVSPQIPVILTLPSILINKKDLPMDLQSEEIHTALVSETEKNYIFKRSEPKISWNLISTDKENQISTFLYAALQKSVIERIEDVFKRQGVKLSAIEISYAALIRGISVSGVLDDCIEGNSSWCALVIKSNSNAVITLKGSEILNILETPLSLKSLDADDLYPALSANLIEKVEGAVDTMLIVNYSREIDLNSLITYFSFKCPVIKIENDCYNGQPLFRYIPDPNNDIVSPEVIGSSCWKNAPIKFGFNFLGSSTSAEGSNILANIGLAGNIVHLFLFAAIIISTVLITISSLAFIQINSYLENEYSQMTAECNTYQAKFSQPVQKVFNLYDVVQAGFSSNEKFIDSFDAIGSVIPEKLWVDAVRIDSSLTAEVKGKAYNIEDIISYYKNLLSVSKFNNFKIKSIKVIGENTSPEGNNPGVSVNTDGNNRPDEFPPSRGAPGLPPPPSVFGNPVASVSGPQKYYEFNFGNPTIAPQVFDTTQDPSQKSFIPSFEDIAKGLNIGNQNSGESPPKNNNPNPPSPEAPH